MQILHEGDDGGPRGNPFISLPFAHVGLGSFGCENWSDGGKEDFGASINPYQYIQGGMVNA